jgi:hypothetical protein
MTITVSREAEDFLRTIECPEGKVLRLEETWSATGKRLVRFETGEPKDGDEVLWQEGDTSLHAARSVSEAFDGFVVRRVETSKGVGVTLSPPEAGEFSE